MISKISTIQEEDSTSKVMHNMHEKLKILTSFNNGDYSSTQNQKSPLSADGFMATIQSWPDQSEEGKGMLKIDQYKSIHRHKMSDKI